MDFVEGELLAVSVPDTVLDADRVLLGVWDRLTVGLGETELLRLILEDAEEVGELLTVVDTERLLVFVTVAVLEWVFVDETVEERVWSLDALVLTVAVEEGVLALNRVLVPEAVDERDGPILLDELPLLDEVTDTLRLRVGLTEDVSLRVIRGLVVEDKEVMDVPEERMLALELRVGLTDHE